jgi:hypothetical protein
MSNQKSLQKSNQQNASLSAKQDTKHAPNSGLVPSTKSRLSSLLATLLSIILLLGCLSVLPACKTSSKSESGSAGQSSEKKTGDSKSSKSSTSSVSSDSSASSAASASSSASTTKDFGLGRANKDVSVEDFVKNTLAKQIVIYESKARSFWPDNHATGMHVVVEDLDTGKFWQVSPKGAVKEITEADLKSYNIVRQKTINGFSPFKSEKVSGMYLSTNSEMVKSTLLWTGAGAPSSIYTHEGFHFYEQNHWTKPQSIANEQRDLAQKQVEARAKRRLLLTQLKDAVANPDMRDELVKAAVSTYKDYKKLFAEDYKNCVYWDTVEGTARYYELVSSLYTMFPDTIKTKKDLFAALAQLAAKADGASELIYYGSSWEAYGVGSFAGILLDMLMGDRSSEWKRSVMKDQNVSPMDILEQRYNNQTLPAPAKIPQEIMDFVTEQSKK